VTLAGAVLNIGLSAPPPQVGQSFVIVDNDGNDPIAGTFNGKPEGSVFTAGGTTFRITYVGGSGNDIVLTVIAVPGQQVPTLGTVALLLVGIGLAFVGWRVVAA
jgi:hypothetical protein